MTDTPVSVPAPIRPATGWRLWIPRLVVALLLVPPVLLVLWNVGKAYYYRATDGSHGAEGIAWRQDFATAQAEAARTGKPLLIDFSASWCPPCQIMKHETWPDAAVRRLANERYIPVYMDVDSDTARPVASRYDVVTIPTVVIAAPDGTQQKRAGFLTAGQMAEFLGK